MDLDRIDFALLRPAPGNQPGIGRVAEEVFCYVGPTIRFDCAGNLKATLSYCSSASLVTLIGFSFDDPVILTYFSSFDLAIVFCSYYCLNSAPQQLPLQADSSLSTCQA